jgi:hypothetical protein
MELRRLAAVWRSKKGSSVTYHSQRQDGHEHLEIGGRGGDGFLGRGFREPALQGEEDGGPSEETVAGEDLGGERVSWGGGGK